VWSLDDQKLFSASKDVVIEWRVGQAGRVKEAFSRGGRFQGLGISFDGSLVTARMDDESSEAMEEQEGAALYVWPGHGGGGNNIEQAYRSVALPSPATSLVMTANPSLDASMSFAQNLMVVGTEDGSYLLVDLKAALGGPEDGDAAASPIMTRVLHSNRVAALGLSIDGTCLFSAAQDGTVYVSDLKIARDMLP
jgi:WD40 repeat protein